MTTVLLAAVIVLSFAQLLALRRIGRQLDAMVTELTHICQMTQTTYRMEVVER